MIIREIHTNLYGNAAYAAISAAFKAIRSGLVPGMSRKCKKTVRNANVSTAPNGEIVVSFDGARILSYELVSYVKNKNDAVSRAWIAWQLKDVAKSADVAWKRNNTEVLTVLKTLTDCDITVQEAYCIYDILMGRKTVSKRYPEGMVEKLVGVENDPFMTEMEVKRRNEIKLITDEYAAKIKDNDFDNWLSAIKDRFDKEVDALCKKYRAESEATMAQLKEERAKKIEEVNAMFDAMKCM